MVEEDTFFAWLDGELGAAEAARVEAEVAADAELARRAAEHRALGVRLRGAFEAVTVSPVPEALTAAVQPRRSNVIDFSAWRAQLSRPFTSPAPQWAAMAAALVLGIAVGTTLAGERGSSPVEVRGGAIYAAGAVDQALERQLASADRSGDVRTGLTFRDQSGAICRTFESNVSSGLACREDGSWRLRGLFAAPEGAGAEYRMAAGADPRLLEMVDSTISGEPLDAAQERSAREQGWR